MISTPDRVKAIALIDEAVSTGARRFKACEELGISERTYRRWNGEDGIQTDGRPNAKRPTPNNKFSDEEKQKILDTCNSAEYADLPPGQIVPRLADKGVYIGSESSFYRTLHEASQQNHRGRAKAAQPRSKPTSYCATAPNQVWTWDVSYLPSPVRGQFYYLYMILDIFSRKITGWEVHECESGDYASTLVHKAVITEFGVNQLLSYSQPLVLHADNGSIQKGSTLKAKLDFLGVTSSFSRPRVSNDNPYSESLFRTCKYCPQYPTEGFESLQAAREWMSTFVNWYNNEHRHSGIKHVTPSQRHNNTDEELLARRDALYKAERLKHPNRWSGNTRNWQRVEQVWLNPDKAENYGHQERHKAA